MSYPTTQPSFTTYRSALWAEPHELTGADWCPVIFTRFRPTNVKLNEAQRKYKVEQGVMTRAAMRRKR